MAIEITDSAVKEIRKQAIKRGTPQASLRAGIRGGGCTGFSYLFEWADGDPKPHDKVFEKDGVKLYVDPKSFVYLDGTTLDFVTSIMGHGFKFQNPNVKSTCGCGESVQF
jgi:iron-sulfur cluster assembly protein